MGNDGWWSSMYGILIPTKLMFFAGFLKNKKWSQSYVSIHWVCIFHFPIPRPTFPAMLLRGGRPKLQENMELLDDCSAFQWLMFFDMEYNMDHIWSNIWTYLQTNVVPLKIHRHLLCDSDGAKAFPPWRFQREGKVWGLWTSWVAILFVFLREWLDMRAQFFCGIWLFLMVCVVYTLHS